MLPSGFITPLLWLLPLFLLGAILKLPVVKGWFGERLVIRRGEKTLPAAIYRPFHDVTLQDADGTTQVDHIYVSIFGIFVVETKQMTGWIFGREHDSQWTQTIFKKKAKFQNPLLQNMRHTKALEALLRLPPSRFHSLVVFSGDAKLKSDTPDSVCMLNDFDSHIRSFKEPVLSREDVEEICKKIEVGRLAPTHATRKAHVADLNRRHGGNASQSERGSSGFRHAMDAGLGIVLVKLVVGLIIVLSLTGVLKSVLRPFQHALAGGDVGTTPRDALPVPQQTPGTAVLQTTQPPGIPAIEDSPAGMPAYGPPTPAEMRESRRQADQATRILERSTPEM